MTRRPDIWAFLIFVAFASACENQSGRKIKLADMPSSQNGNARTASSVLKVAPEEQTSIAILNFANTTGNANLDWLERGLADMLIAKLSQSVYFNLVPLNRVAEKLEQIGKTIKDLGDPEVEQKLSETVENILSGSLSMNGDGIHLEAVLKNLKSGQIIKRESVQGPDLESILVMVDDLSERLRINLYGDLVAAREERFRLTEMTQSVEAFQCYSKALEYIDRFLYEDADSCLSRAVFLDSTFASAYLHLAEIQYRHGKMEMVASNLKRARKFAKKLSQPDLITLRMFEAELNGDIEQIIVALEDFMKLEPEDIDARLKMANQLRKMCRYDEALQEYETILELDPTLKAAYNQLGYLYAERGDFATGLAFMDKYQELAPDEPNPYDSRGEILTSSCRFSEAVEQFQMALSKRPDFMNSIKGLREAYSELDDFENAMKWANRAITSAGSGYTQALAYVDRALLSWRFGKIAEARGALKKAHQLFPALVNPALIGGEMYRSIGDRPAAQQLQRGYLNWFKKTKLNNEIDNESLYAMLHFSIEADLPPEELIPVVEAITAGETRGMQRQFFDIYLATLNLRAGNYGQAKEYLKSQNDIFLNLLTRVRPSPRSDSWKYSIEAIQLLPPEKTPDYTYFDQLIARAQQANRQDVEMMGRLLRAQYDEKNARLDDMVSEYVSTGMPREGEWMVIGPFPNRAGFHREFPPEEKIDLSANYRNGKRSINWRAAEDGVHDGYVDLAAILQSSSWAVGYGAINIYSPDKRSVQLRLSTDEACKLWINDKLVWQVYRKGSVPLDNDIVSVLLHPGNNKVLLKVSNKIKDWGFYFRVTDEKGNGFPDIKFVRIDKNIEA